VLEDAVAGFIPKSVRTMCPNAPAMMSIKRMVTQFIGCPMIFQFNGSITIYPPFLDAIKYPPQAEGVGIVLRSLLFVGNVILHESE
jgi:hypothetical protein